jgi:plastocyanin
VKTLMMIGIALATVGAGPGGHGKASTSPNRSLAQTPGDTVVVKMVDKSPSSFAFVPAHVTVHSGDVLEFVQTATTPHDVVFTKVPAGVNLGSRKVGPFLTQPGQTYDLVIDETFKPGHYDFVCLPHQALGMKGSLDVGADASNHSNQLEARAREAAADASSGNPRFTATHVGHLGASLIRLKMAPWR